ncbi:MAG: flagellar basal body P-ring formation protein FlgA [Gammaproteobacteria bacterium]|nr:flagellar basal body P-ring formation protein FlgA [Gammaproteobacteria bacterium]
MIHANRPARRPAPRARRTGPLWLGLGLGLLLGGGAAATTPLSDHQQLRDLATAHALEQAQRSAPDGARLRAEAARLDPRLRLPACAVSPETFDPPGRRGGANVSVGVRCLSGAEWTLYIPVRVEMRAEVLVLGNAAGRGETLRAEHLRLEEHDVAQLNGGWMTSPEEAVGMMLRRPLRPGQVITREALEPPRLVRRGQRVAVIAGVGGIAVRSEGEALSDAAAGERVRVRNLRSRQIIEGLVDDRGQVLAGR